MVKGRSKRVVVIRPQGKKLFEEAIFILRDDAARNGGYSAEDVVREAESVAEQYLRGQSGRSWQRWRAWIPVASGVAGLLAGWGIWLVI